MPVTTAPRCGAPLSRSDAAAVAADGEGGLGTKEVPCRVAVVIIALPLWEAEAAAVVPLSVLPPLCEAEVVTGPPRGLTRATEVDVEAPMLWSRVAEWGLMPPAPTAVAEAEVAPKKPHSFWTTVRGGERGASDGVGSTAAAESTAALSAGGALGCLPLA